MKINNIVYFEPEKRTISGGGKISGLSASATLCLELLIDNVGELVTHQQLYDFAWRRFGTEPTRTSLHQNISNIRRALSKTGLKENIIRTVPRRGFLLLSSTEITNEDAVIESATFLDNQEDSKYFSAEGSPIIDENIRLTTFDDLKHQDSIVRSELKKINIYYCAVGCASSLLIVMLLFVFHSHDEIDDLFLPEVLNYKGCHLYLNSSSAMTHQKIIKIAERLDVSCGNKHYLYITAYKHSGRVSVLACEKPHSSSQFSNCHSNYYIENY